VLCLLTPPHQESFFRVLLGLSMVSTVPAVLTSPTYPRVIPHSDTGSSPLTMESLFPDRKRGSWRFQSSCKDCVISRCPVIRDGFVGRRRFVNQAVELRAGFSGRDGIHRCSNYQSSVRCRRTPVSSDGCSCVCLVSGSPLSAGARCRHAIDINLSLRLCGCRTMLSGFK